ncbi:hypothetical protein BDV12DRAFT_59287 [Aspergillus spectabilis]
MGIQTELMAANWSTIVQALVTLPLVSFIGIAIYNFFFHSLRCYPGPKLWAITNIPWNYYNLRCRLPFRLLELHNQYGPVVRISPGQLSYNSPASWKGVYSGTGTTENLKDLHQGFGIPQEADPNEWPMTVSDTSKHRRIRRALLPAFSERALRDQTPLIKSYIDLLITRLRERADKGPEDINTWVNRFTFDTLGHFCFGTSFGALEDSKTPDAVDVLSESGGYLPISQFAIQYGLTRILALFAPTAMVNTMKEFNRVTTGLVQGVMDQMKAGATSSGLFLSYVLEDPEAKKHISQKEASIEGRMILTAGAETTTSAITGSLYYISKNPATYQEIVKEIRSTFSSEDQMTNEAVAALKYTNAVLKESLRLYPPVPGTIPRVTPASGAQILGQYVPGNTIVGVSPFSASRSAKNFHQPDQFHPERWLAKESGVPEHQVFLNDKTEASQPFSYGPRSCLGKSLAWVEIRHLLTRLLWNFDIAVAPESENWMDAQLATVPWVKAGLMVNLKPIVR